MPRYFFQVVSSDVVPDQDGIDLPDLAAARHAAIDIAAERLKGSGEEFWHYGKWRLEVTNTAGTALLALTVIAETLAPAQYSPEPGDMSPTEA